MTINLVDAAKFFAGEQHQVDAWAYLQENTDPGTLEEFAHRYRTVDLPEEVEAGIEWPITKAQLGEIMQVDPANLPDSLMDDLALCVEDFKIKPLLNLAYFLGQCGHESCGLRYPLEISNGDYLEGRLDIGNNHPGDGHKFRGTGYIQVTGRANHQAFADYLAKIGQTDPRIMEEGADYTCNIRPWSISGHWWLSNGMNEFCSRSPDIDRVGERVNGRYLPNGYQERRAYTERAFKALGV